MQKNPPVLITGVLDVFFMQNQNFCNIYLL